MPLLPPENILIVNATIILLAIIIVLIILNAAIRYRRLIGDNLAQARFKWRVLRLIFILLVLALAATFFNLFLGF